MYLSTWSPHVCLSTMRVPVFVTMQSSSRQGRLNSDLRVIAVLRPITAYIFHVEVARCTPSQQGTVVSCFAVTFLPGFEVPAVLIHVAEQYSQPRL